MEYTGDADTINRLRPCLYNMKKTIMRRLLLIALMLCSLVAVEARSYRVGDVPNVHTMDKRRFVSNPDGILSSEAVATLDSICYSLKERGLAEVVVVAVADITPRDMVGFSQELFEGWGVGDDELDNGLGILLVEDMREIRFHTGYGVEGVLPDALCYRIQQDYMLPSFRDGDYSDGMVRGLRAVDAVLSGGDLPVAEDEDDVAAMWMAAIITLLMVLIPLLLIVVHAYNLTKCPNCGKHALKVVSKDEVRQSAAVTLVVEKLVCERCHSEHTRTTRRDNNHRGGGGGIWIMPMGGGFGRGGGGFGGGSFGGGSFGGGGSGSSW